MTTDAPTAPQPPEPPLDAAVLAARIMGRDDAVWPIPNVSKTRLGWTDIHNRLRHEIPALVEWAATITAKHVVLIGMGGSSLGPEVLRSAVGSTRLFVLDTTDPLTVDRMPADDTVFLISSKSGGTLEVRSLLAHAWSKVSDPSRYVAITDPGTELEGIANERKFGKVFVNDPNIGGRYSVLSYFGLVPAALLGYDVEALLQSARDVDLVASARLGIEVAHAAMAGRNKLTISVPPAFASFGLWVEQLIAESTGKRGVGVVPVPVVAGSPNEQGEDRHHVSALLSTPTDLGGAFLHWEVATAAMGHVLGIDPFDEPNVTESKNNTKRVLDGLAEGPLPVIDSVNSDAVAGWLSETVRPGDYICVQAYLPYGSEAGLAALRGRLTKQFGAATTAGFGPRFLHSTGQLHKGGANNIVSVQIVPSSPTALVPVPGAPYDFATLISAQSIGDHQSLRTHDRRVLRVTVDGLSADPFGGICT
jgi:Phosphoglucose isomerase